MATKLTPSPIKLPYSPQIEIVQTNPSPTHHNNGLPTIASSTNALFPGLLEDRRESDADRYFTASSGDERYEDDDEDFNEEDDDDDGMCIMLDSDDDDADAGSLSGLHINLKTLQAVSNMLAHYTPVIQTDAHGNPVFVPPPPPSQEPSANVTPYKSSPKSPNTRGVLKSSVGEVSEDFQIALQELENVITAEEDTFLVDKMSELTEVMEKMTYFSTESVDDI